MATATGTVRTERVRGQFFLPAVITGFLALMLGLLGFEQFLNAMTLGAIYALIALGYTMVYGIIELINFAHGDVFMVATFVNLDHQSDRPLHRDDCGDGAGWRTH